MQEIEWTLGMISCAFNHVTMSLHSHVTTRSCDQWMPFYESTYLKEMMYVAIYTENRLYHLSSDLVLIQPLSCIDHTTMPSFLHTFTPLTEFYIYYTVAINIMAIELMSPSLFSHGMLNSTMLTCVVTLLWKHFNKFSVVCYNNYQAFYSAVCLTQSSIVYKSHNLFKQLFLRFRYNGNKKKKPHAMTSMSWCDCQTWNITPTLMVLWWNFVVLYRFLRWFCW